ncbi:hypothetical protein [Streptomyces sp. NPDC090022]|uniref:DUF7691 family protein n=1 Tax=Streptomyces sp. NPDC090022 TaxID=3365920 RepID=UPI00381B4EDD
MSHVISMKTATMSRILAYLPVAGELTDNQERVLGIIREHARAGQASLDHEGIDWGITVPEALEHLLAGRPEATGPYVGNAYYTALQNIIECHGSDPTDVGVYSKPSTFFGLLDEELAGLGVPADLLPHGFLYAGVPEEIPFPIPSPLDGYPAIGHLPMARLKEVIDAYNAVLDRLDGSFTYDLKQLLELLQVEYDELQTSLKYGHAPDAILFWIQG